MIRIYSYKEYNDTIRQIAITGHGKVKPALVITNDFDLKVEEIIRKYNKRWLVKKSISNSGEIKITGDKIEVKMKKNVIYRKYLQSWSAIKILKYLG